MDEQGERREEKELIVLVTWKTVQKLRSPSEQEGAQDLEYLAKTPVSGRVRVSLGAVTKPRQDTETGTGSPT